MARRVVHEREDRVISELCDHLTLREGVEVVVTGRPDREPGSNGGCDAIIQRGAGACAVEVTRVFQAPQHPRFVKRLEEIKPAIAARVVAAFPSSIIMIGVPAEDFEPGLDWQALAQSVADAAIAALRDLSPGVQLPVAVPGLPTRAFVRVIWQGVPEGFCAVNPVVWGRDPEDLTVDDLCRALADKRASMRGYQEMGMRTVLLLDCEALAWPPYVSGLFGRAIELEDPSAFDEVYAALSAHSPSFVIPLKLGAVAPVGQPELGDFIGLRATVERMRRG
jgi:hypothetical protein